jgi:hypothetical protein
MSALPSSRDHGLRLAWSASSPQERTVKGYATVAPSDHIEFSQKAHAWAGRAYDHAEVIAGLAELEVMIPAWAAELGESALFWQAVCERISALEDMAGADGWIYVNQQVDDMLDRRHIDPSGWSGFFNA